ncbi:SNF2-related protein [Micromonospora sp. WMMD975]|uniref:SNF2-related protein n=1 Tax=Micromonospora sp. WMMD975 TaxID=3016087 RepID=UPI00249A6688|nr:SNF2-related protein [Micromonospora sp. WMMD975]WFE36633.1 SNF2-related protein [Micromonospora sp. WMMD975]
MERPITAELLEGGEVSLGPAEATRLGLANHSVDLTLVVEQESLPVTWVAGRRRLVGEALTEYLQDTGRVGGLLRLERRGGEAIRLIVLAPGARLSSAARLPGLVATAPAGPVASGAGSRADTARQRRASTGGRYRLRKREEYTWRGEIGFLNTARTHMTDALRQRGWDPAEALRMRLVGERLATLDQFDELLAIDAAHIEHMPHQEAAARTVLTRMGGRGILADEVGLGKTVEAGLILKELMLRGLAQRVLIICPAPLRDQWRDELHDKFDEDFTVVASGQDATAFAQDRLIMTLQLVLRNAHRLDERFDLVIVDEAHRLSGAGARKTRGIIGDLIAEAPRVLFLSATPVQNNLLELYRLVELLRPGTFDSERDFVRRFVDGRDPRKPVNAPELRKLISSVVVRTTRQQAGVDRVHRMPPQDHAVALTAPERQLYDMLLHTLRHRMTGPSDTMRRRQLALRLTASPQAVSRSALRMAEREFDGALKHTLTEIGHLAGDIRHTSREQVALDVVRRWLDEHGRVLIFTQHTDTLGGILRLLDADGIGAAPFHGGMSHAARSASVADFKSGRAQVLVSTDAGAEGQNLQVSNCVLNYDLPWNPMRVEQRIGRVHRLTQTRDVHIANLFARDTLDESVYRLLHDKLAMFELLFGQVVTVLGELEGTQDSSMEQRVLDALYAKSDATMQLRLDELGAQLEQARSRAMAMMSADAGLSDWLAQRKEERRQRAAQPEARELLPQQAQQPRRRQKDLERFVRQFLELAGATLTHPAEGFTIAALPPPLAAAFGGRTELFLAFTNTALDHHPETQLCVVGSELFDELLEVLRDRGDLAGTVAVLPHLHQRAVVAHTAGLRLVKRHVEPDDGWSARATYRVQEGATSGNQQLVTVDVGRPVPPRQRRSAQPDGAPMPATLAEAAVLDAVEQQAAVHLRQHLRDARQAEQRRRAEAQEALVANLEKQLGEAQKSWQRSRNMDTYLQVMERERQLERAIEAARRPAPAAVDTELRAELLTLEMHGSDRLIVVESWEHTSGVTREIRYPWTGDLTDHRLVCEATGTTLNTLALCGDGHAVDHSALSGCQVCDTDWCRACGPRRTVQACAGCGRDACATCRRSGAFCAGCARPHRAPELDTDWEHGWRLGGEAYLLVGARHAVAVAADATRRTLVPDADVRDPARARLRGLAARLHLPAGAGLVAATPPVAPDVLSAGSVWSRVQQSVWWTWQDHAAADIDATITDLLPDLTGPDVVGEGDSGLSALLADLRRRTPAPAPPAVAAVPHAVVQRVDLTDGQFHYRELWHDGDRPPLPADADSQPLTPSHHEVSPSCRPVAATTVGPVGVEVDGFHASFVCLLTDGTHSSSLFVPGVPGATLAAEEQLARTVVAAGLPPTRTVVRHPWTAPRAEDLRYSLPADGTTVTRRVAVSRTLLYEGHGEPETVAETTGAASSEFAAATQVDDARLRDVLVGLAEPTAPVPIGQYVTVQERWRSPYGSATRRYLVAPAAPLNPQLLAGHTLIAPGAALAARLTDGSVADGPVCVDSRGHLFADQHGATCPVCRRLYGPCCGPDGAVIDCASCHRPACGVCRSHDPSTVTATRCERCGDRSCGDCDRHLPLRSCQLCGRQVCPTCGPGPACRTCQALAPATDEQIGQLPAALHADGLTALLGQDDGGTVAVLRGAHRLEIAVTAESGLQRWETATADDPELLRLLLATARVAGSGDVALHTAPSRMVPVPPDWLVLTYQPGESFQWLVRRDGTRQAGNAPSLADAPHSSGLDPTLRADLADALGVDNVPVPTSAAAARRQLIRRAAGDVSASPAPAVAVACRQHTDLTVAVTARGLVRRRALGAQIHEETADWQVPDVVAAWMSDGWNPTPEVLAAASLDGWAAVIAVVGHHGLLGVRHDDDKPTWYSLTDDTEVDLLRAALGVELLGQHTLATVIAHTSVRDVRGPVLLGATPLARRATRQITRLSFGQPRRTAMSPAAAVAAVLPGTTPAAPTAEGVLPAALLAQLRRRAAQHRVSEVDLTVGLAIEEQWRLADGTGMTVAYQLAAGETVGYLPDAVTGQQLHQAHVCRRQHLVAQVTVCATCLTATCPACPDPVMPCALCYGHLCGRCAASPDRRCPACAQIRKVKLLERGKFGVSLRGAAWHGVGPHAQVTVRRDKGNWSVERWNNAGKRTTPLASDRLLSVRRMIGDLE